MFKITSRFYVIYGDGEPIYVGYTNRTVKQRFAEHQHDKDFGQYNEVKVKELKDEKLSFDFTWDYIKTCENAYLVSKREAELVSRFGTQKTEYQKATGGGQTWASEKSFVKSNHNNPKFLGMTTSQLKACLSARKREQVWLGSFVYGMKSKEQTWIFHFVNNMYPQEHVWLRDFVNHMRFPEQLWLSHFVGNMQPKEQVWLRDFVNGMRPKEQLWLSSFVNGIKPQDKVWLNNFVNHMQPKERVWLSNFTSTMIAKEK